MESKKKSIVKKQKSAEYADQHLQQQQQSSSEPQIQPSLNRLLRNAPPSTMQLGGKGTIRRRRLRKTNSLGSNDNLANSEAMYHFMKKFQFRDYGIIECLTFITDSGTLTSYDSVNMCANLKNQFYQFNLSNYAAQQRKRSKIKLIDPAVIQRAIPGMRVDTLEALLSSNRNQQDICELVGSDGYDYLIRLANDNQNNNNNNNKNLMTEREQRDSNLKSSNLLSPPPPTLIEEPADFLPTLVDDFEAISNTVDVVPSSWQMQSTTISSSLISREESFLSFEENLTTNSSYNDMVSSNEEIDFSSGSVSASLNKLSVSSRNLEPIYEVNTSTTTPSPPQSDISDKINEFIKKKKKVCLSNTRVEGVVHVSHSTTWI